MLKPTTMNKIFFIADTHFGHKNVLKLCPNRPFAQENDTVAHDEWLMEMWNSTVNKNDYIYILGDFSFSPPNKTIALLERLSGRKHFIVGNHDKQTDKIAHLFESVSQIKDLVFTPQIHPFLNTEICVTLCHYPMVSWNKKPYGAIMLHGHCHGNIDAFNAESNELRFDVGIDGELSRQCGGIVDLETIYQAATSKAGTDDFRSYSQTNYRKDLL